MAAAHGVVVGLAGREVTGHGAEEVIGEGEGGERGRVRETDVSAGVGWISFYGRA